MAEHIDANEIRDRLDRSPITMAGYAYNGNAKDITFYPLPCIYVIRSFIDHNETIQKANKAEDAAKLYNEIELCSPLSELRA